MTVPEATMSGAKALVVRTVIDLTSKLPKSGDPPSHALDSLLEHSEGYPYFLQEFGKQAWNAAEGPVITAADLDRSTTLALDELENGFFRARVDKTSDGERNYLRAMAQLDGRGPYGSGDVAMALEKSTTQAGPVRDSLIKRGLIFAPRHGQVAFTVPMFEQFILRRLR